MVLDGLLSILNYHHFEELFAHVPDLDTLASEAVAGYLYAAFEVYLVDDERIFGFN